MNKRSGSVLVVALILSVITMIAGAGLFTYSRLLLVSTSRTLVAKKAHWAAEGGLMTAKIALDQTDAQRGDLSDIDPSELILNGLAVSLTTEDVGTDFKITASVVNASAGRRVEVSTKAYLPSLARWGWGMQNSRTWMMYDTNPSMTGGGLYGVTWKSKHMVVGPFYSAEAIGVPGSDVGLMGIVYAPEFFSSAGGATPYNAALDAGEEPGEDELAGALTDEQLNDRLPGGYVKDASPRDLIGEVKENYEQLYTGSFDYGSSTDAGDTVYEFKFDKNGTYQVRETKAVLVAHKYTSGAGANQSLQVKDDSGESARVFFQMEFKNPVKNADGSYSDYGTTEGWSTSENIDSSGEIIRVAGDALVYGELNGSVTLVAGDNVFIGSDGMVYESVGKQDLSSSGYNDDQVNDMMGIVASRQVILMTDMVGDSTTVDAYLHASVLLCDDVDPNFGEEYDLFESTGDPIYRSDVLNGSGGSIGSSKQFDNGLPTYFYKLYGTTGIHPWDLHTNRDYDSQFNFYGGMTQYRYSRTTPAEGSGVRRGLKRVFVYDNRFARQTPIGYNADKYIFYDWESTTSAL